jgi:hypothetical protein
VLAALLVFQVMATAGAPRLAIVESLTPPETTVAALVASRPLRPATPANATPAVGRGWAGPVSMATAQYAYEVQTRYFEIPSRPAPTAVSPLTEVEGLNKSWIADVVAVPRPGPVISQHRGLTLRDDPSSPFRLELDNLRGVVTVAVDGVPEVAFEIDYRDRGADLHRIGVTPILLGHRLEGSVPRSFGDVTYPLVTPTYDAGSITHTTISNEGGVLLIRFDGGPYSNLSSSQDAEGATYLEVQVELTGRKVLMDLAGLYYVRPAVGAEMLFVDKRQTTPLTVAADVPSFLVYLENPTRVDVTDPVFGDYRLRTDVTRLQVQWDGAGTAFELDFDHAFKDRGQTDVQTRIIFRTGGRG